MSKNEMEFLKKEYELYSMKISQLKQANKIHSAEPAPVKQNYNFKFKNLNFTRIVPNDKYHYSCCSPSSMSFSDNTVKTHNYPKYNQFKSSPFVRKYKCWNTKSRIDSYQKPIYKNVKQSFTSRYALKRSNSSHSVQRIRINKYKLINRKVQNNSYTRRRSKLFRYVNSSFSNNSYPRPNALVKYHVASRLIDRSWKCLLTRKSNKYCMFYNKFGKCHKGENCPDIHDPEKVSVCTRFLRGTCTISNCPFSHIVTKDKMPTCIYFMKGTCWKSDCPYNHVKVGKSAEICKDFLNGHCAMGEQCKKKHILVCPEFSQSGSCPLAEKCPMRHVRKKSKRLSACKNKDKIIKQKNMETKEKNVSETPSFIALCSSDESFTCDLVEDKNNFNFLFSSLNDFSIIPRLD